MKYFIRTWKVTAMDKKETLPRASTPLLMEIDVSDQNNEFSVSNMTLNCISNISEFDLSEERNAEPNIRDDLIERVMRIYIRHNLTKIAVEDIAKLVNQIPGGSIKIPETKHSLFNEFLSASELKVFRYTLCKKCDGYKKHGFSQKTKICEQCQTNLKGEEKSFIYFQVESQLKRILLEYDQEISEYTDKCLGRAGHKIFDICDGELMKNLSQKGDFYSLTFNTDGVEIHKSSRCSLWPVLLTCNFLPPRMRFKEQNMIMAGLYYGTQKPEFSLFLTPLVEEMNKLSDGLIVNSKCFKFVISHAALDLPARAAVQCMTQYNGYNSCSFCESPGEKTPKGIRHTFSTEPYPRRTHKSILLAIQHLRAKNVPIHGVKGLSPMIAFKHFDLVHSFVIDYMHMGLIGIVKNMTDMWIDSTNHKEPYYLTTPQKRIINRRIASIRPCRFISRRIGPLEQFKIFKASQFRSFLLFFYPVLEGILKPKYYNHFALLSSSIYLLLKSEISMTDLHQAEKKLQQFVKEYQSLYGKTRMNMNAHSATHLVDCVRNNGPLWAYSMFHFESYNGKLKAFGEDSVNVVNQIVEKIVAQNTKLNKPLEVKIDRSVHLKNEIPQPPINLKEIMAMENHPISEC